MTETFSGEPTFPARTAGYFPDDDAKTYWMQTLNDVQRERAQSEAAWAARERCRPYRKGGKKHGALVADARSLDAEAQALHLAGHDVFMGRPQRDARDQHPDPERPERKPDETDEAWMTACDKWEAEKKKAADKRRKEEEKAVESRRKSAMAMDPKARVDACVEASIERAFAEFYVEALRLEILARAVRKPDEHREMAFEGIQEIEDLPDAGLSLWEFYCSLDTVSSQEVPT